MLLFTLPFLLFASGCIHKNVAEKISLKNKSAEQLHESNQELRPKTAIIDLGLNSSHIETQRNALSLREEEYAAKADDIIMPINNLSDAAIANLHVQKPHDFKSITARTYGNTPFLEYIPETDTDPYMWSEILTVGGMQGCGLESKDFAGFIREGILGQAVYSKTLCHKTIQTDMYQATKLIIEYMNKGRHELMICFAFSGPYDCAYVQYATLITDACTQEQAMANATHFLNTYARIFFNNNILLLNQLTFS